MLRKAQSNLSLAYRHWQIPGSWASWKRWPLLVCCRFINRDVTNPTLSFVNDRWGTSSLSEAQRRVDDVSARRQRDRWCSSAPHSFASWLAVVSLHCIPPNLNRITFSFIIAYQVFTVRAHKSYCHIWRGARRTNSLIIARSQPCGTGWGKHGVSVRCQGTECYRGQL